MSVADMHRLADALTVAYHERGLTFNQVYVIPQEIQSNTLILNVLAGRLSEIDVSNNSLYSDAMIKAPFLHLIGNVVYEPDIKAAMQKVNQLPGLKVFGFFSVGRHLGETRLNLHVMHEIPQTSSIRLDNWGVQNTGAARATYQYQRNNLTGRADILSATLMATNENGNLYGGVNYRLPHGQKQTIGGSINTSQFAIAGNLSEFGLSGHLETLSGFWNVNLLFDRNARADLDTNLAAKQATITSDIFKDVFAEKEQYYTLQSRFQAAVFDPRSGVRQALEITPTLGWIGSTDNKTLDDLFFTLNTNFDLQYLWKAKPIQGWSSRLNMNLFVTSQKIPSAERPVLTGAQAVRGYKPALFSADKSFSLAVEQAMQSFKWLKSLWKPFAFLDYAKGKQNDSFGNNASFLAAGLGLDWEYGQALQARITAGYPISTTSSAEYLQNHYSAVVFGYISMEF